ncbi:MAG: LptF/LptG family permease [Phycisphaerae bacterium]|nr:LptF/LptG family permease [Phycisphaerae bacterium]
MLWTLQGYIFREMGKAFLLTAVALTALAGLTGGVMNILEAEQMTTRQLVLVMVRILPISAALVLPVAALFAATVTYGRLSADNELTACRASGINIHHLLLPTLLFSLVSALVTFYTINYVIPGLWANVAELVKSDAVHIVQNRLQSPGRLPLGQKARIYADAAEAVPGQVVDGVRRPDLLNLTRVAFVRMDKDRWISYGTAERVDIRFDKTVEPPTVAGEMYGAHYFDHKKLQWIGQEYSPLEATPIPQQADLKLKWRNLTELWRFVREPGMVPEIQEPLDLLRNAMVDASYYHGLAEQWSAAFDRREPLSLGDDKVRFELRSGNAVADAADGRLTFTDGVEVRQIIGDRHKTLKAGRAAVRIRRSEGGSAEVTLEFLDGVEISDPATPGRSSHKDQWESDPFALPSAVTDEVMRLSPRELLDRDAADTFRLRPQVRKLHGKLCDRLAVIRRDLVALIHARLAFSASVLVLVVLGAALAVVFRGSHVLTAFGIAFVPSVLMTVIIIMGRQMAEKPGTALTGLLIIWGGITLVGVLDILVLTRFVRR